MMTVLPIVLITPEAKAALEAEAERAGATGDVVGGLLFGYPLDERRRLIVASVRLRPEVNFGTRIFSLDQSRTSQQLADARKLDREAKYCGVWYVHRTPTGELTDDEWVQAQRVLEDPDFSFKDLVCLVVCLYLGELNTYALSFNLHHSARGQLPASTLLKLTTEAPLAQKGPARAPADRSRDPHVAEGRLDIAPDRTLQGNAPDESPGVTPDEAVDPHVPDLRGGFRDRLAGLYGYRAYKTVVSGAARDSFREGRKRVDKDRRAQQRHKRSNKGEHGQGPQRRGGHAPLAPAPPRTRPRRAA